MHVLFAMEDHNLSKSQSRAIFVLSLLFNCIYFMHVRSATIITMFPRMPKPVEYNVDAFGESGGFGNIRLFNSLKLFCSIRLLSALCWHWNKIFFFLFFRVWHTTGMSYYDRGVPNIWLCLAVGGGGETINGHFGFAKGTFTFALGAAFCLARGSDLRVAFLDEAVLLAAMG